MLSNRYKLLVVDVDGTLVNKYGKISAEDRTALAKAQDLGIGVSLSTGRVLKACLNIIRQLSLNSYHISFDGALVSSPDHSEELYVQPIAKTVVKKMVELAHAHYLDLELFTVTDYFTERETWSTEAHRQFFDVEATIVDFTNLWEKARIIKGGLVTITPEEAARAQHFCQQFGDSLHFSWARTPAYPSVDFINLLAPKVSKGKALKTLASHLGISLTEVIAIGDGSNDISLLAAAGLAIAMGNAPDEVKKVADYTTLDIDHSGVAAAINRVLLQG
ncbi:MAG: HAD family phosphatase [Dehalococcoidia bacterium]|nr:MAG: HAD family phosphatase [Dehalococcoidia bacterium]